MLIMGITLLNKMQDELDAACSRSASARRATFFGAQRNASRGGDDEQEDGLS